MTAQGERYGRYVGWIGSDQGTYDGNQIGAGQSITGETGYTQDAALHKITASLTRQGYDPNKPLMDYMAGAAAQLNVPGGWDSVGKQLPDTKPVWPPFNIIADYDFTKGDPGGLSFGSLVAGTVARDTLESVGTNELRRSSLGLMVEPQATNLCTNFNLKPTDTTGTSTSGDVSTYEIVQRGNLPGDLLAELNAIDPKGRTTGVSHVVTSAAGTVRVNGATGGTGAFTGSAFVKVRYGTVRLRLSGSGTTTVVPPGALVRVEVVEPSAGSTETLVIESTDAAEWYFLGNGLEAGSARTSPIEVNGSTTTRLGDNVFTAVPAGLNTSAFTVECLFNKYIPVGAVPERVIFLAGVTPLQDQIVNVSSISRLTNGTSSVSGPAYVPETDRLRQWGANGTTLEAITNGTSDGTTAWTPPASYTNVHFGVDADGTRQVGGYIKRVIFFQIGPPAP